ncbi:MAG: hypothetical protein JWP67_1891 [Mucilaginibacter sp.]|nr:hypothetical protein [Mucilaginibacter sp.]
MNKQTLNSKFKFAQEDLELFKSQRDIKQELIISESGILNSVDTWFDKVKIVLSVENNPLTIREILNRIYEYFDTVSKANGRKNIISLSTILNEKSKEGKLVKIVEDNKIAKFKLPETISTI